MTIRQWPSIPSRIVLVGFMGAGKTTVGRLLAQRLGWTFVDLDDCIRAREGREIAEIFRASGEAYFRRVESECLRELLETQGPSTRANSGRSLGMTRVCGMVLALGGGAFVQASNAAMLKTAGARVIFLDASLDELKRRCEEEGAGRPLFQDENQFRQLYEARRGSYMAAERRMETGGKTPAQVVDEIVQFLGLDSQVVDQAGDVE